MRILVVEDQSDLLGMVIDFLESKGYECEGAESAPEGLEVFKNGMFDLVITDYNMPHLKGVRFSNGYELLCEIRKIDVDVPVILLSSTDNMKSDWTKGFRKVVRKPVKLGDLLAIIETGL